MSLININRKNVSNIASKSNPFFSLQHELNRAISDFYGNFEPFNFPAERFENLAINPAMDIVDELDQFKVEVEMPGLSEEDLKISINNNVLTIKGEKTTSKKDQGKNYLMREINYGAYERNIVLPESVDIEKAKASFRKGMLWVAIPKKTSANRKSRTLTVEKA